MNIKKLLACLLALVMVLSLVACGGDAGTTDDVDTDPQPAEDVDQQPDAGDEQTSPEGQSLMEILKDRFVAVPDLAGTTWTFIGGYMQGVQLTKENTADILSQMDDLYQFEFIDDTTAVLTEGLDTITEGTYEVAADGMTAKIVVGEVTYAGTFIEQEDGYVLVAMLDGTGMNALYFHLVIEG